MLVTELKTLKLRFRGSDFPASPKRNDCCLVLGPLQGAAFVVSDASTLMCGKTCLSNRINLAVSLISVIVRSHQRCIEVCKKALLLFSSPAF